MEVLYFVVLVLDLEVAAYMSLNVEVADLMSLNIKVKFNTSLPFILVISYNKPLVDM